MTLTAVMVFFMASGTNSAHAHLAAKPKQNTLKSRLASQTENLAHAKYVCRRGGGAHKRWACKAIEWLTRERDETRAALRPPSIREYVMQNHPCLHGIIEVENRTYDPTLDYGGGHGNVYEPYGIPQANPGTKMASAGPDWRTNPWTQLRWMIGYVVGRYGGECQALAYRRAHGYY